MPRDSHSPHLWKNNVVALLVVLSCGGKQVPKNPEVSGAGLGLIRAEVVEVKTPERQAAHQLAGEWKLSLWSRSHGTVVGTLHLEDTGHGRYLVTATGFRRSGDLRVTAWDGEWLEGKALGIRKRVRATMQGSILYVELPIVGEVTLIRHSPQGGTVRFSGS